MGDCLFCKIVSGDIAADIVYSDEVVVGFADVAPQAPHHYLFVPREHIATLNDAKNDHALVLGALLLGASELAKERNFAQKRLPSRDELQQRRRANSLPYPSTCIGRAIAGLATRLGLEVEGDFLMWNLLALDLAIA